VAAIPKRGLTRSAAGLEPADQPTDGADRLLEQVGVGWEVDVGLDHGGIDAQLAAAHELVGGELAEQHGVALGEHLRADPVHELAQRGGVRDGLIQRDAGKPPPRDRVADLPAQGLVAQAIPVLELQQPQQGWERDGWPPEGGGGVGAPGGEEPLVVEIGVDAGEFIGQACGWSGSKSSQRISGRVVMRSSEISNNSDKGCHSARTARYPDPIPPAHSPS
jgi:hypothetical protein